MKRVCTNLSHPRAVTGPVLREVSKARPEGEPPVTVRYLDLVCEVCGRSQGIKRVVISSDSEGRESMNEDIMLTLPAVAPDQFKVVMWTIGLVVFAPIVLGLTILAVMLTLGARDSHTVAEGDAFEHGDFAVEDGWSMRSGLFGWTYVEDMWVTNEGNWDQRATFDLRLLRDDTLLVSVYCRTDRLEPGQRAEMDCMSTDDYPDEYTEVQVS